MLPELGEIKLKRKQLGLTQAELAGKAGVSQSLITKIESGKLVPAYDNAKRIFDFLEGLHLKAELKACDLMSSRVLSIRPAISVKEAARIMRRNAISQLPVVEGGRVVGSLSEKAIVEQMRSSSDLIDLKELKVSEIMDEAMPLISEDTPFAVLAPLLEHESALLVAKKGRLVGIITKADILGAMLARKWVQAP